MAQAKDLCTLARAYQDLQGVTNQDALLSTRITAASDAIQKYCRRGFVSTSYDELFCGHGDRRMMLRRYPLISVESVRDPPRHDPQDHQHPRPPRTSTSP